jgi:hypothetical protein
MGHSVLNNYPYALCALRSANCMGLGGWRQKEQSIIGETAE